MKEWKLEGVSGLEEPSLQSGNAGDEKEARNKAVYYLQFSSKTEWELRKKLAEQGFLPASVDSAIRFVKAHRYLDDGEYAARYIERNQRKKSRKVYRITPASPEKIWEKNKSIDLRKSDYT